MALWDPNNALSVEAPALVAVADLLSQCTGCQRLVEKFTPGETLAELIIGPWDEDIDQEAAQITERDLAFRHAVVQLLPSGDEPHTVSEDDAAASCPDEGGVFEIWIRRQVRDEELSDGGRRDVYLFVLDCVSAIERQLVELGWTSGTLRIRSVRRLAGPEFEERDEVTAQGAYIEAVLAVEWGHGEGL